MIPPFDDRGYLPPGIHPATLEEIEERFGRESELRRAQMESLRWMMEAARRAGVLRVVINGSFTTEAYEPNDVDCVLLVVPGSSYDEEAESELLDGLPFLDLHLVGQKDFDEFVGEVFATDRFSSLKGMVEVVP